MLADGMCEAKISCNVITEETASLASSEVIADGRFKRTGDETMEDCVRGGNENAQ